MKKSTKIMAGTAIAMIGVLGFGTVTVMAADSAKPGDMLYSVDLFAEDVQRSFISGDDDLADYEMDVLDEREEELEALQEEGDDENLSEAIDNLAEQETEVQDKLRAMNESGEGVDDGEKVRVNERAEEQVQEHTQTLEQIQQELQSRENYDDANDIEEIRSQYEKRADVTGGNSGNGGSNGGNNN